MPTFDTLRATLESTPWLATLVAIALLLIAAFVADRVTQRILLRLVRRAVAATPTDYDDALLSRGVIDRLAHVVPALVISAGLPQIPYAPDSVVAIGRNVAVAYMVLTVALAIGSALKAIGDIYERTDPVRARNRPIKGYLQLLQIVGAVVAAVLMIAALIDRSPLILFSGLGALTAVLLLVFKDTILSFVAAVQLSSNDMLRVGDWLQMPGLDADGEVVDIALHTVKVQNWDRTITTIPTWRLINESFKNWRGMSESGGRRIKRALMLDQSSVRFLSDDERDRLRRFALIDDYLARKRQELEAFNQVLLAEGKDPVNTRRVTNLGTFRAYVDAYLEAHPRIHRSMTRMVRHLPPGEHGLPMEVYCFTSTTVWSEYEAIQADIFDHLLAILPSFGLRVFQQPTGADMRDAFSAVASPAR